MVDQAPATAFLNFGSYLNWPPHNKPPAMSIGFTLTHGTWPVYRKSDATTTSRLWRSPQFTEYGGALWDEPGRFGTIDIWKKKPIWTAYKGTWLHWLHDLHQFNADLAVERRWLDLPWNPKWVTPGGTDQTRSDNGVIIDLGSGQYYAVQGMRPAHGGDHLLSGIRTQGQGTRDGDWVCDGVGLYKPGTVPHGSQGPKAKHDGLITPSFLSGFIPNIEVRLVGLNVEYGAGARAVKPGWVERPFSGIYNGNPFGPASGVIMPEGPDPKMMPNFVGFAIDISDAEIERWIAHLDRKYPGKRTDRYRESQRWAARNLRGWPHDDVRPSGPLKTRIRLSETGGGEPIFESVGRYSHGKEFAALGVSTDSDAYRIGEDLFLFARLVVTDGVA